VQEQLDANPEYKDVKEGRSVASKEAGGWPDNGALRVRNIVMSWSDVLSIVIVQAPSAIPFSPSYPVPQEMTSSKIEGLKQAFKDAVERCKQAGFDFIEIHGAHVSGFG
jgi:2,4-dienoyl-CoA reductase-like NADH-dependent reductase (Old Yellow Enzyme family)